MESEPDTNTTIHVRFSLPQYYSDEDNIQYNSTSESESDTNHKISNSSYNLNSKGAFGNKSSPNKLPSRCKSRISRDTLTGRIRKRKGKPGSRKYHRWENEKILGRREDELSDTGPQEDEMERYLFDPSSQNIFYQMFEDKKLYKTWQRFFDITEEEESFLLNIESDSDSSDNETIYCNNGFSKYNSPFDAFQRLTKEGRKSIRKYSQTQFLHNLDSVLYDFIQNDQIISLSFSDFFSWEICTSGKLYLFMKDSFHRLMAHNITNYYNGHSFSDIIDGIKTIIITPPSSFKYTPSKHLYDFIQENYNNISFTSIKTKSISNNKILSSFSNEPNVGWI